MMNNMKVQFFNLVGCVTKAEQEVLRWWNGRAQRGAFQPLIAQMHVECHLFPAKLTVFLQFLHINCNAVYIYIPTFVNEFCHYTAKVSYCVVRILFPTSLFLMLS
jgi:hypothetical protein